MLKFSGLIILLLSLLVPLSYAEEAQDTKDTQKATQSGWLEPKTGSEESTVGARVQSIYKLQEEEVQRIEVSLPKTEKTIEEIVVIGKKEGIETQLEQLKRFEVINDPETGRSGVVIYLGKKQSFALKINYYEGDKNY